MNKDGMVLDCVCVIVAVVPKILGVRRIVDLEPGKTPLEGTERAPIWLVIHRWSGSLWRDPRLRETIFGRIGVILNLVVPIVTTSIADCDVHSASTRGGLILVDWQGTLVSVIVAIEDYVKASFVYHVLHVASHLRHLLHRVLGAAGVPRGVPSTNEPGRAGFVHLG